MSKVATCTLNGQRRHSYDPRVETSMRAALDSGLMILNSGFPQGGSALRYENVCNQVSVSPGSASRSIVEAWQQYARAVAVVASSMHFRRGRGSAPLFSVDETPQSTGKASLSPKMYVLVLSNTARAERVCEMVAISKTDLSTSRKIPFRPQSIVKINEIRV